VLVGVSVVAVAFASTGCASKKYVQEQVGQVNTKVESVSKSLEETQERTRKNEAAIADVNSKLGQVDQRVTTVNTTATTAKTTADTASTKVDAIDKANKRVVYQTTLSEDQGNFKFDSATLSDAAKAKIDDVVKPQLANPNGAFFEIEGYTDNIGSKEYNQKLGLDRAEAVKRYIYEQYHVALFRINVISYGSENPVAPNTTAAGRAQNRRVVIKVVN
jgi:outer membrane protein OmpA-like peptidoglycan-associated protein